MINLIRAFRGVDLIIAGLALILTLVVSLSLHEYAHALAADICGDDTPRVNGRLTLNPVVHMDPMGLLFCIIFGFGWAKPVEVNPVKFRDYKKGRAWVSIAGVLTNYILAVIFYFMYVICMKFIITYNTVLIFIETFCYMMFNLNIMLFVFNLLPFYPLDGFNFVSTFAKPDSKFMKFAFEKGTMILLISLIVDEVMYAMMGLSIFNLLVDIASLPITLLFGLIL